MVTKQRRGTCVDTAAEIANRGRSIWETPLLPSTRRSSWSLRVRKFRILGLPLTTTGLPWLWCLDCLLTVPFARLTDFVSAALLHLLPCASSATAWAGPPLHVALRSLWLRLSCTVTSLLPSTFRGKFVDDLPGIRLHSLYAQSASVD